MTSVWKYYDKNSRVPLPIECFDIWNNAIAEFFLKMQVEMYPVLTLAERETDGNIEYAFMVYINPENRAPRAKKRLSKIIIKHSQTKDEITTLEDIL